MTRIKHHLGFLIRALPSWAQHRLIETCGLKPCTGRHDAKPDCDVCGARL